MGVYQLKQAKSYIAEPITAEGDYKLSYLKETPTIIRLQLQSRHTSSKVCVLWIEYGEFVHSIIGWFCKCQAGARVVGCCAHVASVLWYLGHFRHREATPGAINTNAVEAVDDAAAAGSSDDSSQVCLRIKNHYKSQKRGFITYYFSVLRAVTTNKNIISALS